MGAPVTVITGAGSGIGRATAELLAATGHRLMLFDRDEDGLSETRKALVADAEAIAIAVTLLMNLTLARWPKGR